ncbi:MAG: hypothetical protein KC897_01270 [Candidatus Omnitrophica bacterium]|nr:hypothetical protein [Candidatus Omnitrophota bacterium]MCB9720113.1 hypothetical protein [Candidatus Omnitrophota bacterium]
MNKRIVFLLCISLLLFSPPVFAKDIPKLSSSLARNLWRQCHAYPGRGMEAKVIRACSDLEIWAHNNNETAVAQAAAERLDSLEGREQQAVTAQPSREKRVARVQNTDPLCGFESEDQIPPNIAVKIVGATPAEFLSCRTNTDCVAAQNYCGTVKSVNKMSLACYETAARIFERSSRCAPVPPLQAAAVCRKQICTLQF